MYTSSPSNIDTLAQGISDVSLDIAGESVEEQGSSYISQKGESSIEISGRDQNLSRHITSRDAPPRSQHIDSSMGSMGFFWLEL